MSDVRVRAHTPDFVCLRSVIEVTCARGAGTQDDVVRMVTQFWSEDGKLLAEHDPRPERDALREAAPALLEALREANEALLIIATDLSVSNRPTSLIERVRSQANDAIAKAEWGVG